MYQRNGQPFEAVRFYYACFLMSLFGKKSAELFKENGIDDEENQHGWCCHE